MKVLSVQQPYAWALVHGPKRIENRTWNTPYRGPVAIHASRNQVRRYEFITEQGRELLAPQPQLVFGAIIGVMDLRYCFDAASAHEAFPDQREFISGPECWCLFDPIPLTRPIPCKGRLGLWWHDDERINARLMNKDVMQG